MRHLVAVLTLALLGLSGPLAAPASAQANTETLADIRQELSVLYVEVQRLKRELVTTGAPGGAVAGGSALERLDNIESELQRLTSQTEELQHRINVVVTDGTNRVGDLEFRLCELEQGCDLGAIGQTETLGGGDMPAVRGAGNSGTFGGGSGAGSDAGGGLINDGVGNLPAPGNGGAGASAGNTPQLAMSEQVDFDRAKAALDSGSFRSAADEFATFAETYPGGPLTGPAHFWRGEALTALGDTAPAARAYLESFSGDPEGRMAPDALYMLGVSLGQLGQTNEACVTLGEVQARFPQSEVSFDAGQSRRNLGCS
ncbi:MAG: tol-pal system protein YbgF [Celeribacter sp.]|jgi:tol-pal system protein YbgF